MSRTGYTKPSSVKFDFEAIKERLENDVLNLRDVTELAEDLVSHVEYWMNKERGKDNG